MRRVQLSVECRNVRTADLRLLPHFLKAYVVHRFPKTEHLRVVSYLKGVVVRSRSKEDGVTAVGKVKITGERLVLVTPSILGVSLQQELCGARVVTGVHHQDRIWPQWRIWLFFHDDDDGGGSAWTCRGAAVRL